jgi:hypothetical protein
MRAVAAYGPDPVVKGKRQDKSLPAGQYGPLFILGNGLVAFFVLALISARGGTAAKLAAAAGLIMDLALLLKSVPHLQQLALVYDSPRAWKPESLTPYTTTEAGVPSIGTGAKSGGGGGTSAGGASSGKAQSYAHSQLTRYGLRVSEFPLLVKLWNKESGWSTTAKNAGTGATGIPQLNPNDHTVPADWSSYKVQVDWGLKYIAGTYGSIRAAWDSEEHRGWY